MLHAATRYRSTELWLQPRPAAQRVAPPHRGAQHRASDRSARMPIAGTKFVSVARSRDSAKWQLPSRRIAAPVIPLWPPALSPKVWPLLHSGPISLSPLSSSSSHIRLLSSHHAATIRTSALSWAGPDFLWLQPANRVLVERAVARPSTKRRPGPLVPASPRSMVNPPPACLRSRPQPCPVLDLLWRRRPEPRLGAYCARGWLRSLGG